MTPKDPSLEPDPDAPGASGTEDGPEAPAGRSGRRPPGPGDQPISNLPPPASALEGDEPALADPGDDPRSAEVDPVSDPTSGGAAEVELEPGADAEASDGLAITGAEDDGPRSEGAAIEVEVEGPVDPEVEVEPDPPAAPGPPTTLRLGGPVAEGGPPEAGLEGYVEEPDVAAEAADPEAVDVPPAGPAVGSGGPSSHRVRRLIAVAAVVAVAAFTVLKVQEADDLSAERDDRAAVEDVARAFGAAYLTYDFQHVDRSARALHHLATPAFAEAYAAQSAPSIQELFASRQTVTTAETQEVFVGAVRRASARALVVVDVTARSATDGDQQLDDVSFVLDLARTNGGWKVAKVARSPQATLATIPPAPATTTTTAAP